MAALPASAMERSGADTAGLAALGREASRSAPAMRDSRNTYPLANTMANAAALPRTNRRFHFLTQVSWETSCDSSEFFSRASFSRRVQLKF
ncbi:MAG: hypothetical protein HY770_07190 [Chitinivibrionia bacterium]|nr:hypothetical protein [Chitinivibrionia bacterium]